MAVHASANYYFLDDESDYIQPTVFADRGRLHVEARYNYEDRETGSLWAGHNLTGGEAVTFEFTPMIGVAFGRVAGVAPGYRATLGWRDVELYSEGELVIDAGDRDDSFFYTWTELSVAPSERWRAGLVIQRTKAWESPFDIQRGVLLGFQGGRFDATAYVLNPGESPVFVLGVGASL